MGKTSSSIKVACSKDINSFTEALPVGPLLQLRMSEKTPNGNIPFLNTTSVKLPQSDFKWHLRRAIKMNENAAFIKHHSIKGFLRRNLFVLLNITAVTLSVILGFTLRPKNLSQREITYFGFPGELLMRMLQMLVLPLIVSSLVTATSSLDKKASGKMGMHAMVYYMVTTLIAVFIGIAVVLTIQPGKGRKGSSVGRNIESIQTIDALLDLIRNMIPHNLVEACFKQYKTVYKSTARNETGSPNLTEKQLVPVPSSSDGVNALGLVVFSVCLGLIIGNMKQQGQVLFEFFDSLNEAIMRMVAVVIWYTPVGILFLITGKILEMTDLAEMGSQLGLYTVSVIVGLIIHAFIVLPLLFYMVTKNNPYKVMGGALQALITALGTSSSSATLPITFHCLEENIGVNKRVTRFVLPLGATINMDGTALYEAVAAIFIAQVNGMELNFGQILTVSITATAASIGAAGIPQAGLVTMVMVLASVGLPAEDIGLIIAVDWFLDRLRTTVNVLGDSFGAGIVEYLSHQELQSQECDQSSAVVEEHEKPYHLICLEDDVVVPHDSETPM